MTRPVSTSRIGQVWRGPEPGLKDAAHRLRRSPAAILDPGFGTTRSHGVAGTKERPFLPNQGTGFCIPPRGMASGELTETQVRR